MAVLPPQEILKALELECKTLEKDLEYHHLSTPEDYYSIFCFRQFVRMSQHNELMRCSTSLPPEHIKFYKQIIDRLVDANELPSSAIEQFGITFPPAFES